MAGVTDTICPVPQRLLAVSSSKGGEPWAEAEDGFQVLGGGKELDNRPSSTGSESTCPGYTPSPALRDASSTPVGRPSRCGSSVFGTPPRGNSREIGGAQARKVFIGGIPQEMTQQELLAHFSQYGEVKRAWLQKERAAVNPRGRAHRGFGFIIFCHDESIGNLLGTAFSRHLELPGGIRVEIKRAMSSNDLAVEPPSLPRVATPAAARSPTSTPLRSSAQPYAREAPMAPPLSSVPPMPYAAPPSWPMQWTTAPPPTADPMQREDSYEWMAQLPQPAEIPQFPCAESIYYLIQNYSQEELTKLLIEGAPDYYTD